MSAVWTHFKLCDNVYYNCVLVRCRGEESKSFNTSNLIKYLRTHHKPEYTDFAKTNAKPQQPTLTQVLEKQEKMSRENQRAVKITETLTHFIALDDQPLSVVENVGFCHLLSPLFDEVKKHVRNLVNEASALSFTTDIWTSSVCPMSLLSLTAQWIDDEFVRHQVTLQAKFFPGLTHSQTIAGAFDSMLQTSDIPKTSVTLAFCHRGVLLMR